LKNKVHVETSVLISASLFAFLRDLNQEIKHEFFDRSMKLMGYFAANVSKRIGVATTTVEREAFGVLERVVREEIEKRSIDYRASSFILNACNDRLRRNFDSLVREPVQRKRVDELFVKVSAMYVLLHQRAELLDKGTLKAVAREKAELASSKRYRGIATKIYAKQEYDSFAQLRRLNIRRASTADMMTLAEAAYLKEIYAAEGEVTMHVASTDKLMSPIIANDGSVISENITQEIEANFGILCDWPERVLQKLT